MTQAYSSDIHKTLWNGLIDEWAFLKANSGEIMPTDKDVLALMFHQEVVSTRLKISPTIRIKSRDYLKQHNVTGQDVPLTVLEKLQNCGAIYHYSVNTKDLQRPHYRMFVFVFADAQTRDHTFRLASQELSGLIDAKKSSVVKRILRTVFGADIVYVVNDDFFEIPDKLIEQGHLIGYIVK